MNDKKQTPLQQAINWIDEKMKGQDPTKNIAVEAILLVKEYLENVSLPAEKQFAKDMWDASGAYACYSDGPCSEYAPDFDELIKQFEP